MLFLWFCLFCVACASAPPTLLNWTTSSNSALSQEPIDVQLAGLYEQYSLGIVHPPYLDLTPAQFMYQLRMAEKKARSGEPVDHEMEREVWEAVRMQLLTQLFRLERTERFITLNGDTEAVCMLVTAGVGNHKKNYGYVKA